MEPQNNESLKKHTFRGVIWSFAEQISTKLVSFVVSIILARILVPEDYSLVSIVSIFFVLSNVMIYNGLNTSLIQKKDADSLDYSTALWTILALTLIMYIGMFLCAPLIAELYDKPLLIPIIRVMALTFFINGFKSVLVSYITIQLQFRKFFFSTITGTVISAFIGIAMALRGFGAWALVVQEMSNNLIDMLCLLLTTRLPVSFSFSVKRLRRLFSFGVRNVAASLIHNVYENIVPLIIGLRFTDSDLAYYTKANSFPTLLNTILSETMAGVLFPVLSKLQDCLEDVCGITRRYFKTASYIIFPIMLGLFAVSDSFVVLLLTEKWLPASIYIRVFCIAYMFNLINVGTTQAIQAIGRSDILLKLEILKKTLSAGMLIVLVFFSDKAELLAFSSIFGTLIAVMINVFPNHFLIGYRFRWQLADILPNLLLSVCMCVVVMLAGKIPLPTFPLLAVQVLTGVLVYVVLSIVTKNESFWYILDSGKQMLKRG